MYGIVLWRVSTFACLASLISALVGYLAVPILFIALPSLLGNSYLLAGWVGLILINSLVCWAYSDSGRGNALRKLIDLLNILMLLSLSVMIRSSHFLSAGLAPIPITYLVGLALLLLLATHLRRAKPLDSNVQAIRFFEFRVIGKISLEVFQSIQQVFFSWLRHLKEEDHPERVSLRFLLSTLSADTVDQYANPFFNQYAKSYAPLPSDDLDVTFNSMGLDQGTCSLTPIISDYMMPTERIITNYKG